MARPRLCASPPPLPAVEDVELSPHAVERFIQRCWRERRTVRFADAEAALRELVAGGEVMRGRPDGFALPGCTRRFDRPDVVAYVVCDAEPRVALPVRMINRRPVAVTTIVPVA